MGFLRLLLAITVVIAHSNSLFGFKGPGSLVAVELFFMISGFYMTMILDKKYVGENSYLLFLSNRFLRLYPLFWTVLLLTILVEFFMHYILGAGWFRLSSYVKYYDITSVGTLFFQVTTNIILFGQDIAMFLGFNPETGNMYFTSNFHNSSPPFYSFLFVPQAWSLGIEVLFYLMAPFLVRRSNRFIILTIILSISIRLFTYSLGYMYDPWTYRFFPSELALFMLGALSYRLFDVYKIHQTKFFNIKLVSPVTVLFFLIIICYQYISPIDANSKQIFNLFLYLFFCLSLPFIFQLSKSSKIDSKIGELSYPVYISHLLVISVTMPILYINGMIKYRGEVSIVFTILFSYILVKTISDPVERIRQKRVDLHKQSE